MRSTKGRLPLVILNVLSKVGEEKEIESELAILRIEKIISLRS